MTPTRDEILAEPAGPRMDAWVAVDVMEYEIKGNIVLFPDGDYSYLVPDLGGHWTPSQNIAVAWEVVEKMQSEPFSLGIKFSEELANMCDANQDDYIVDTFNLLMNINPLTICRAALLAKLEQP